MSLIKHSIIVFLLLNVVRESVCDDEVDYSVVLVTKQQPILGRSNIDLPNLLALASKDTDGNMLIGKGSNSVVYQSIADSNSDTGTGNTIKGHGNDVTGSYNVIIGDGNFISGSHNRITGNGNMVSRSGVTFTGNNAVIT